MDIKVSRRGHRSLWNYRKKLERFGLSYDGREKEYAGRFDEDSRSGAAMIRKIERYCHWHGLVINYGKFGDRSTDYRKEFFRHNPPVFKMFGKRYYFCSYCGIPVSSREMQVDHLYPVAKVKSSRALQDKLRRSGLSSVNDHRNLVPACPACNCRKSSHMGFWIPAGVIGRHQKIWPVRWAVRIAVMIAIVYAVLM